MYRVILGPEGAWWLKERVEGCFPVLVDRRVEKTTADGTGVVLRLAGPDGTTDALQVDHVIAATGYRVDVGALDFLAPDIRAGIAPAGGWPRLSSTFQSAVRGLDFTGLAAAASF